MFTLKQKLIAVVFMLALFLIALPPSQTASAQANSATCAYHIQAGGQTRAFNDTFDNCAVFIYFQMNRAAELQGFGTWGQYTVAVDVNRDVYYGVPTPRGEVNSWTYWGDLGFLELSLDEVVDLGVLDVNEYWSNLFADNNIRYREPNITYFDGNNQRSACGASRISSPVYCSGDHTIYLPAGFLDTYFERVGDYSAVLIIAHEWGHAVQAQLGLIGSTYTIYTELQADCLAGAYSAYAASDSPNVILEYGDIDEAATALFMFGDNLPWFDPHAHGSGEQRMEAFYKGMDEGLEVCWAYTNR